MLYFGGEGIFSAAWEELLRTESWVLSFYFIYLGWTHHAWVHPEEVTLLKGILHGGLICAVSVCLSACLRGLDQKSDWNHPHGLLHLCKVDNWAGAEDKCCYRVGSLPTSSCIFWHFSWMNFHTQKCHVWSIVCRNCTCILRKYLEQAILLVQSHRSDFYFYWMLNL